MESHNKTGTMIGVGIVGLLLGGLGGWWIAAMNNTHDMDMEASTSVSENRPNSATKAADLRATLVGFGVEHMDLTYATVAATLNASKSADADAKDLYKNGTDLGAAIGSVYGKEAESTFNSVWKLHLDEFVKYAMASSKNDAAGKKAALDTIDAEYTKPLAAYLAKANPNLPEDTLYKGLKAHVDMTAEMIDEEAAGNYAVATDLRNKGADHLSKLFSTLAAGIVKQFPDKF